MPRRPEPDEDSGEELSGEERGGAGTRRSGRSKAAKGRGEDRGGDRGAGRGASRSGKRADSRDDAWDDDQDDGAVEEPVSGARGKSGPQSKRGAVPEPAGREGREGREMDRDSSEDDEGGVAEAGAGANADANESSRGARANKVPKASKASKAPKISKAGDSARDLKSGKTSKSGKTLIAGKAGKPAKTGKSSEAAEDQGDSLPRGGRGGAERARRARDSARAGGGSGGDGDDGDTDGGRAGSSGSAGSAGPADSADPADPASTRGRSKRSGSAKGAKRSDSPSQGQRRPSSTANRRVPSGSRRVRPVSAVLVDQRNFLHLHRRLELGSYGISFLATQERQRHSMRALLSPLSPFNHKCSQGMYSRVYNGGDYAGDLLLDFDARDVRDDPACLYASWQDEGTPVQPGRLAPSPCPSFEILIDSLPSRLASASVLRLRGVSAFRPLLRMAICEIAFDGSLKVVGNVLSLPLLEGMEGLEDAPTVPLTERRRAGRGGDSTTVTRSVSRSASRSASRATSRSASRGGGRASLESDDEYISAGTPLNKDPIKVKVDLVNHFGVFLLFEFTYLVCASEGDAHGNHEITLGTSFLPLSPASQFHTAGKTCAFGSSAKKGYARLCEVGEDTSMFQDRSPLLDLLPRTALHSRAGKMLVSSSSSKARKRSRSSKSARTARSSSRRGGRGSPDASDASDASDGLGGGFPQANAESACADNCGVPYVHVMEDIALGAYLSPFSHGKKSLSVFKRGFSSIGSPLFDAGDSSARPDPGDLFVVRTRRCSQAELERLHRLPNTCLVPSGCLSLLDHVAASFASLYVLPRSPALAADVRLGVNIQPTRRRRGEGDLTVGSDLRAMDAILSGFGRTPASLQPGRVLGRCGSGSLYLLASYWAARHASLPKRLTSVISKTILPPEALKSRDRLFLTNFLQCLREFNGFLRREAMASPANWFGCGQPSVWGVEARDAADWALSVVAEGVAVEGAGEELSEVGAPDWYAPI